MLLCGSVRPCLFFLQLHLHSSTAYASSLCNLCGHATTPSGDEPSHGCVACVSKPHSYTLSPGSACIADAIELISLLRATNQQTAKVSLRAPHSAQGVGARTWFPTDNAPARWATAAHAVAALAPLRGTREARRLFCRTATATVCCPKACLSGAQTTLRCVVRLCQATASQQALQLTKGRTAGATTLLLESVGAPLQQHKADVVCVCAPPSARVTFFSGIALACHIASSVCIC